MSVNLSISSTPDRPRPSRNRLLTRFKRGLAGLTGPYVLLVGHSAGETAAQVPVQIELHRELAALSSNSIHHVVEGASHAGLASHSEYLPEVTAAIRQVMNAAQTGTVLDGRYGASLAADLEQLRGTESAI